LKASNATSNKPARNAGPRAKTGSSSSTDRHFILGGPSRPVDARIHAWRKDLADIGLAGRIFAPHYARPLPRGCGAHPAMIWPGPSAEGDAVSELLPGESFAVLEYAGGWAWGFSSGDHVVGYVEGIALVDPVDATHIVCEKNAPITSDGAVTAPVIATMPLGSRLRGLEKGASLATEYGCVPLSHLRGADDHDSDPVIVAERLIGAPFLAGGRTASGMDSAALVQLALSLCGISAPRLLDQLGTLGAHVPDKDSARRGDLVLFDPGSGPGQAPGSGPRQAPGSGPGQAGGAGLMIDDLLMIHASQAAGKVLVEPIALYAAERRRLPL
jgi:hypothetical protein